MTKDQRETVDAMLRSAPFDLGGDVSVQRPLMEQMLTAHPLPDDVRTTSAALGGIPVVWVNIDSNTDNNTNTNTNSNTASAQPQLTVLHLHGGGFALGSATSAAGLAADLARHTGARVACVDYRLAPEHPYPAAALDVTAAYAALVDQLGGSERIVISGESAGGNLALGLLISLRDSGSVMPAAAVLMSPMTDLTASGASFTTKASADPNITLAAITTRTHDYLGATGVAADDPHVSPLRADLRGLPPLLIQAGSHETLLSDSTALAVKAASEDVAVTLDITAGVPHVFQAFAAVLDEGEAALSRIARFVHDHAPQPAALTN